VLKDRSTYEIIEAASVARRAARSFSAAHRAHAFADTLAKLGIMIQGDGLNAAFARFKELADRKVQLTDADLEAIVAEEIGTALEEGFVLDVLDVQGGTIGMPRARVVVSRDGRKSEATAEGDGMIDATCKAIKQATASTPSSRISTSRLSPAASTRSGTSSSSWTPTACAHLVVGSRPMLWKRPPGRTSRPPTASSRRKARAVGSGLDAVGETQVTP